MLITIIGLLAAALTSLSYIPQVKKALPAGSTDDISFKTLAVLAAGLALWIGYGILKGDFVIIVAECRRTCLGRHADSIQDPGCR